MGRLTKSQLKRLSAEGDDWTRQEAEWRAGKAFLDLADLGLVEWHSKPAGGVSVGPGAHGHRWHTRRTAAGRAALETPTND